MTTSIFKLVGEIEDHDETSIVDITPCFFFEKVGG